MANATFGVNILPKDNTVSLGNSTSKWNIESPNLTGTPTAPTASSGTNSTQVATTAFVAAALSGKLNVSQGSGNAGKILVVGSNGNIVLETIESATGVPFDGIPNANGQNF